VSRQQVSRLPMVLGTAVALLGSGLVAALGASMAHVVDTNLGYGLVPQNVSMLRFVWGSAAVTMLIVAVVLRYLYVNDGWQAQVRASARAEVDALQARIKPHFLFNSMNTIASLVRHDPPTAERAVEDLAELFRAALGAGEGESTLGEELHLCERYVAIEALRLGDRLKVDWRIGSDVPRRLPMPRLLLQPLLENAVRHGVARMADGGEIVVDVHSEATKLRIEVRNPCPPPCAPAEAGNRHAQGSIAQRLSYHYGERARMTAGYAGGYYSCVLQIPHAPCGLRTQRSPRACLMAKPSPRANVTTSPIVHAYAHPDR
jgi:two-component system sensor histidine kinase AlgZ